MLFKKDWGKVKSVFEDWWNRRLDRPLVQVYSPRSAQETSSGAGLGVEFLEYYPDANSAIDVLFERFSSLLFLKEAYPNLWINLGPGSLSACLGAEAKLEKNHGTVWFEGNSSLDELEDIELDPENKWWQYTIRCAEIAAQRCRNKAVPGFIDLLDVVTVTAQLRGNFPANLIRDMFSDGPRLRNVLERLHAIWFQCYDMLSEALNVSEYGYSTWVGLWSKERHFVPEGDLIVYLSPKLLNEFVYPLIVEECEYFDRTIWHLDGPEELPHLDKLLSIPELDGFQWVPPPWSDAGDDTWFPLYRKIQDRGKLLQLSVPPNKVMNVLDHVSPRGIAISTSCRTYKEAQNLINTFESRYR